jgi:gliding motility-associated-like protein
MYQGNHTLGHSLKRYFGSMGRICGLFFSLFLLFITPLHAQTPCDTIREMIYDGLIAYYPFNGNANDESPNHNHGIVHGATLCPDRFGNPNSAYHFNGQNNYIEIPQSDTLNALTTDFTISFWMKSAGNSSSAFCKSAWGAMPIHFRIQTNNAGINNISMIFDGHDYTFTHQLTINAWYNIVMVFENNDCDLFVNNVKIMTSAITSVAYPFNVNNKLYIGVDPHGGIEYHSGQVDDIMIYRRGLSVEEISLIYTNVSTIIKDTICAGEFYSENGFNLPVQNSAGAFIFTDTLLTAEYGCDSIISLMLTVKPRLTKTLNKSICANQTYNFYGKIRNITGTYKDTVAGTGCDTIVTLNLTVNPLLTKTVDKSICANETYVFYNRILNTSGTYTDTIAGTGCDTIVTLNLTVNPLLTKTVDKSICANETYDFYGTILYTSGTYIETIAGEGCDTIITLNLTVLDLHTEITKEICQGDSIFFIDTWLYNTGIYSNTLLSVLGCDSLITLTLTVQQPAQTTFDETGCVGQRYHKHGFNFTPDSAGTYHLEQQLQTIHSCDSIVNLTLQVPKMEVEISSSNPDFCNTHETVLTAITPNHKIHWNTGDNGPEITVTRHGTYIVTVSELDCKLSTQFTIEICPIVIVFPNAITPGTIDGINDYFYLPAADDVLEFAITIYDRWGSTVFTSADPYFRWDGKVKGKLGQGVYTYACILRTMNLKQQSVTGTITVL